MVLYEYYYYYYNYYYYTTVVRAVYDRVCVAVKITTIVENSHTHIPRHRHREVDFSVLRLCAYHICYKFTSTSIAKYVILFSNIFSRPGVTQNRHTRLKKKW